MVSKSFPRLFLLTIIALLLVIFTNGEVVRKPNQHHDTAAQMRKAAPKKKDSEPAPASRPSPVDVVSAKRRARVVYSQKASAAYESRLDRASGRNDALMAQYRTSPTTPTPPTTKTSTPSVTKSTPPQPTLPNRNQLPQQSFNLYHNRLATSKSTSLRNIHFAKGQSAATILRGQEAMGWIAKLHKKSTRGTVTFTTSSQLERFIALPIRPFTTILSVVAPRLYPPSCQSCHSFQDIITTFTQLVDKKQGLYWNNVATMSTESIPIHFPTTIKELETPFLFEGTDHGSDNDNNNNNTNNHTTSSANTTTTNPLPRNPTPVITIQLDFEHHRDWLRLNAVQSAPFSLIIPPNYNPQRSLSPRFLAEAPLEHKITSGSSHQFFYDDYMNTMTKVLGRGQLTTLGLTNSHHSSLALRNVFEEISIWSLLIPTWCLVLAFAFYFSNITYITTHFTLPRLIIQLAAIIFTSYQLSGPAILKNSPRIGSEPGFSFPDFCQQNRFTWSHFVRLFGSSSATTPTTTPTPLAFIAFFKPVLTLLIDLTARYHTWIHPQAREGYYNEIRVMAGLLCGVTVVVALLVKIAQTVPITVKVDIDRHLALQRHQMMTFERLHEAQCSDGGNNGGDGIKGGDLVKNHGDSNDRQKEQLNHDQTLPTPSTPLRDHNTNTNTQTQSTFWTRLPGQILTYLISNTIVLILVIALFYLIYSHWLAFLKKHSFVQEGVATPIKVTAHYYNLIVGQLGIRHHWINRVFWSLFVDGKK